VYLVVGGYPLERMPYVAEERKRPGYITDEMLQVTWYVVNGSVHEQKNTIIYEMLPHVRMVMKKTYGDILWIPCPMNYKEADYKRDSWEILDCLEKVSEYNERYGTEFKLGFGKMWLPIGEEYVKERVYLANLSACLDVISYHYAQCRVINLGIYTTSTDRKRFNIPVGISGLDNLLFADNEYFERHGFQPTDYCLRTMRQRIKKLLGDEGVEPADWDDQVRDGRVRPPGRYTEDGRIIYDPPKGAPLKETILLRARIRADFSINKDARRILPALPGFSFEQINFSAPGVGADQVCTNMHMTRMYMGNSVMTTVLSANSEFVPELAMIRFDQENGRSEGNHVRIPPAESMSGIEITVSNRKSEAGTSNLKVQARLGSPRGEREKGEVCVVAEIPREERVEKELESARNQQKARASVPQRPLKAIDERTKERLDHSLDSSFEKIEPKKKKKKVQVVESSSSSTETSTSDISTDDDGEPVTRNLVRLQSLKVEVEVARLARLKKKFRKVKRMTKKQKKSAKTKSGD